MVTVAGRSDALVALRRSFIRIALRAGLAVVAVAIVLGSCTARVAPNEFGVEQNRLGSKVGIADHPYGPGLYFIPPGSTMHSFSRELHVLEASYDREDALARAKTPAVAHAVEAYFQRRSELLGGDTDRLIEALNIQTSDGYAVLADVSLLYTIQDPVKVARDFGWGTAYVDSFVVSTFRNGVLTTLGKMNAESFYDEKVRIQHVSEAEALLRERFAERGLEVHRLLLRNYRYAPSYEKSLHDKKVAVQLTVKNERERVVNEEKAKLQRIEGQGNAAITIAESQVEAQISKVRAEAGLYASQVHARADREVKVAEAEAKRLTAEALAFAGSRYVVGLETAKMFDNIQGAVMTPEQYVQFVRATWALIGVGGGGPAPASPAAAGGAR
ncbi:MAG TPA: SPFH domain-containing protein [Vicinamibacteria bacterium]|nr:SPFH domain-containing protein [Vicinamibacteria bacterium]